MCTRTKEFTVAKRLLGMHTLVLDSCVFIWIGERSRLDALGFAHMAKGAILLEGPSRLPIDTLTCRISRLFPQKQVFFSTDLSTDDIEFWADVLKSIVEEVASNAHFYGVSTNANAQ
ncbi:unnamed protein product [Toxocara canis]|nr:unnamed protein product [Toxocara canis]